MTSFIGTVTASVVLIALLVVVVSEVGVQAGGSTFEVNQVENAISQGDGTCDGTCSLRDAILAANSNPGPDTIVFASEVFAPGSGNDNIITPDPLPAIDGSEGITIDGTGAEVVIVGFELNTAGDGLRFISGASEVLHDVTVRNLSIGYFKNGISVCAAPSGELCTFEATDIVIEDVMTFENEVHGIDIGRGATVTNVMVTRVEANVNGGIGIDIEGENIAGVDLTDTDATGNGSHGVSIAANDDASGISMVDSTFVENASRGAQIVSSSGHVRNALVADSDFTDNASLGQSLYITSFDGLQGIEVGDNTVGGPRQGIYMSSAVGGIDVHDNQVEGGTQGIRVVGPGGGTVRILENQVTGGSEEGISTSLDSATTQLEVSGNFVENDGAGSGPAAGIWLGSSTTPAVPYVIEGNEVTGNSGDGIGIWGVANATISRNSTYLNGELGIDLVVDSELPPGVTFNDAGDGDAGPNGLLNTPEWEGGADACPNCLIEIFQSDNDPSGFGEGMQFLAEVTAEATGDFLPALCSLDLAVGTKITATATDQQGHTSEFSPTYPWSGSEPCPTPTPTPTPSATPTPTVTPTATSSASPTSTATSLQTSTPTATPSATSQSGAVWGDSDCDGDVSSRDNQALLRRVLSQPPLSQTEPCADLGDEVMIDGLPRSWGDWDCNGGISSRDNQALLRRVLSQNALSQTEPCPDLGTQS